MKKNNKFSIRKTLIPVCLFFLFCSMTGCPNWGPKPDDPCEDPPPFVPITPEDSAYNLMRGNIEFTHMYVTVYNNRYYNRPMGHYDSTVENNFIPPKYKNSNDSHGSKVISLGIIVKYVEKIILGEDKIVEMKFDQTDPENYKGLVSFYFKNIGTLNNNNDGSYGFDLSKSLSDLIPSHDSTLEYQVLPNYYATSDPGFTASRVWFRETNPISQTPYSTDGFMFKNIEDGKRFIVYDPQYEFNGQAVISEEVKILLRSIYGCNTDDCLPNHPRIEIILQYDEPE